MIAAALEAVQHRGVRGEARSLALNWQQLDEQAWALSMPDGCANLARELSRVLPGQVWCGHGTLTVQIGRKSTWLLDYTRVPDVQDARRAALELTGGPCGWSLGNLARGLLKWACEACRWDCRVEALKVCGEWGYHRVVPCRIQRATLYDLDRAYYELACRLPSPHVVPHPDRVIFRPLPDEQRARWVELLVRLGSHKLLRNALVGAMAGAEGGAARYINGELVPWRGAKGPLRGAALLIVRTCYELCALQAESAGAVYANVDCVVTPGERRPEVWSGYGLPWSVRGQGEADIRGLGVYRCGNYITRSYTERNRIEFPSGEGVVPNPLRCVQWL